MSPGEAFHVEQGDATTVQSGKQDSLRYNIVRIVAVVFMIGNVVRVGTGLGQSVAKRHLSYVLWTISH
jgi:uncharacterized membrane protein YoaK (UPF0700 family)